nr:hypothetical protein [Ligilactobacillus ruminis]
MPCSTAFGKITVVYGHNDENGHAVRKWSSRKMAITDKKAKNLRTNQQKWRFVRKICVKSRCTDQNKKKYVPSQHRF